MRIGRGMQPYSVLMAVHQKADAEYLRAAVDSMAHQTVKPEQIVIVEDGPLTPPLYEVIKKYFAEAPDLFTKVSLAQNGGLANALNIGLRQCRNELVARMDSDDISLPDRCEKQLKRFAQKPELTILGGNMDEFTGDPGHVISQRRVPLTQEEILRFGRRRSPFNHPTVMYKKSAILEFGGYNVERSRAQDYELFVSMLHSGYHAENLEDVLVKFRVDEDSVLRKKSWAHCMTHVDIVKNFYRQGYSTLGDLCYTFCGACAIYLLPNNITQKLYRKFLRR